MKKLSVVFVAALSLAAFGCKKKDADSGSGSGNAAGSSSSASGGGGGDCSAAIANSMAVSKADMAKAPGIDDTVLAKMHDLAVKHCTDDKWPDDAIKCMVGAKTQVEAQGCYGKLTPEQQDKMSKALIHLMTPPADAAGSGTAPAAAPDSGSAGSAAAPK